jgi:hypothetical protein
MASNELKIPVPDLEAMIRIDDELRDMGYVTTKEHDHLIDKLPTKLDKFVGDLVRAGVSKNHADKSAKLADLHNRHTQDIISMSSASLIGPFHALLDRVESDFDILQEGVGDPEQEGVIRTSLDKNLGRLTEMADKMNKWATEREMIRLKALELKMKEKGQGMKKARGGNKPVIGI